MAEMVTKYRLMPMLSIKGRPEVRLAGFGSLVGGRLAGPWQPVTAVPSSSPTPTKAKKEVTEPQENAVAEEATEPSSDSVEPTAEAPGEPVAESADGDPELDKLLANLNEETPPATIPAEVASEADTEPEIDPELAKLLKELG